MAELPRRSLLIGATAFAGLAAAGAQAQPLAIGPRIRRDVGTMVVDDPMLKAYAAAVEAMKALPASDPRSWSRQAQIHQDHCPHRNWYFPPWHRAYLAAFEQSCRELSGVQDFALPY